MEVVILAGRHGDRRRRRRRHRRPAEPQAGRGAGAGHRIVAAGDLRRTGGPLRRRPDLVPAGPRLHPRRVRRPARRPSRAVPDRHRHGVRLPGRLRPRSGRRAPTAWPPTSRPRARHTRTRSSAAGGVDLQILGIGTDGHIGFNEPGSSLASRTRIKTLTRQTRIDNARFFDDDLDAVPTHCLTQGLATIMAARHVILVATGRGKAEAVHHLVEGAVSALWPATILQHHPHVTVLLDDAAAASASARRLLPRDIPLEAEMAGHLRRHAADRRHPADRPRTVASRVD